MSELKIGPVASYTQRYKISGKCIMSFKTELDSFFFLLHNFMRLSWIPYLFIYLFMCYFCATDFLWPCESQGSWTGQPLKAPSNSKGSVILPKVIT